MYDKIDHTDVFTADLDLDVVRLYLFEDLPIVFRRYITYRASRVAATKLVANPQLVKLLAQQEALARAALMEYECNQAIIVCLDLKIILHIKPINLGETLEDNGKYHTNYPSILTRNVRTA